MNTRQFGKALCFGLLTWLLPFLFSFLFYNGQGQLLIDYTLFKSLLVVVGGLTGTPLLALYFIRVTSRYLRHGVIIGLVWFAINILLDTIVLIPWMHVSFGDYMGQIGLRYLSMPIMAITVGYLLQRREATLNVAAHKTV